MNGSKDSIDPGAPPSRDGDDSWPHDTTSSHVVTQHARLGYTTLGTGPDYMVLFHGFGQRASTWLPFVKPFLSRYTFVLVDLFYHGESQWLQRDKPVTNDEWSHLMEGLVQRLGITSFVVGGYSIGCKFALATVMAVPTRVKDLILVAPDGLAQRFWYQVATGSSLGMKLFRWLVLKPGLFFSLANALHNLKLLDGAMLRFVANNMNTRRKRLQVFHSWVTFRALYQTPKSIAQLLNERGIGLQIFIGRWDRVVSRRHVAPLLSKVKRVKLEVLDANHQNLVARVAQHYEQAFAREQAGVVTA